MTLIVSDLQADLKALFTEPPDSNSGCAEKWADIMSQYAKTVTPPVVPGTTDSAAAVLELALDAAFSVPSPDPSLTAPAMEFAWRAFALTLAAAMQPAFTAVPPPLDVGFSTLFAVDASSATHASAAAAVSRAIHTWMLTGTATNNATGATVAWL